MIVVGAGNVANSIHIPSLRKKNKGREHHRYLLYQEEMAEKTAKWGIPRVCTDFDDAIDDMEGASS